MTFTNDDLKRLKECVEEKAKLREHPIDEVYFTMPLESLEALLARLEAAELCINPANCYAVDYETWCKAAGK